MDRYPGNRAPYLAKASPEAGFCGDRALFLVFPFNLKLKIRKISPKRNADGGGPTIPGMGDPNLGGVDISFGVERGTHKNIFRNFDFWILKKGRLASKVLLLASVQKKAKNGVILSFFHTFFAMSCHVRSV